MTRVITVAALSLSLLLTPAASLAQAPNPLPAGDGGIIKVPLAPVVPASQRTCSLKTASGLGYTVLRAAAAAAPKPGATDYVLLEYIGFLAATGAVFDQRTSTPLQLGELIEGMTEGLRMMPKGSVYRICIPASIGYGATAQGSIPANSDLVFQAELLDFKTVAEVQTIMAAQQAAAATPAPNSAATGPNPPAP